MQSRASTPASRFRVLGAGVLLTVLGLMAACTADSKLSDNASRTPDTPPAAGDTASEKSSTLHASQGGTVVADDGGAAITVPPGVMQRDGNVLVKRYTGDVYDIHIDVPWNGTVEISMPPVDDLPIIAHYVDGDWRFENATLVDGRAVATVDSLSFFSDLKECLKALVSANPKGAALKALKCLARLGIKKLPEKLAKKLIKHFNDYDGCQPVSTTNWTIDILEGLFSSCTVSDPGASQSAASPPAAKPGSGAPTGGAPQAPAPAPPAPTTVRPAPTPAPPAPVDRYAVISYDQLRAGAQHAEWYQAWQDFAAQSNTLTRLAINVGDTRWAPGPIPVSTTLRLCRDATCGQQIGAWSTQINNYGATSVDIGDIAVQTGTTYYLRYDRPDSAHTWAVYFWGPGTYNTLSATVRGYNR
jgi:hypothetical protein